MLSRVSRLLTELKRRKVYRVAVVYAVVAFVVWQIAEITFPALSLPTWALTLVVVLAILGFPMALVLAWALEITPDGVRRDAAQGAEGADSRSSAEGDAGMATPATDTSPSTTGGASPPATVAVLPFSNLSTDPEQEFFCHGMAEELINSLTQVEGLRVAARTSSFQFADAPTDVREVGRRLGVASVLEGSVRRSGDRLRVTAQLINAEDGYHLWSETYEREEADVFAIQDEISRAIVETIRPALVGDGPPNPQRPSTRNMEAYELYLRGRLFWHQRYEVGLQKGLEHFQKAASLDPDFALPYTGISDAYVTLALYGFIPPGVGREKAGSALATALTLNPDLGEAYASRGWWRFMCTWEWKEAEEDYRRAMERSPSNVDVRAWFGILCAAQGRFPEAYAHLADGRALDPLSSYLASMEGAVAYMARDFHRAVGILEEVLQQDPGYLFGVFTQEIALPGADRFDEAVTLGERGVALSQDADFFRGLLAVSLAAAGRRQDAGRILQELRKDKATRYVPSIALARGYSALGEADLAVKFLETAVEEQEPFLFGVYQDWGFDPVRGDPRFRALAARVGAGVVGSSYTG